jgi:PAS domain S-box-containing protein
MHPHAIQTAPDAALRLAAIVESSDDAIISKDLSGTITSWNRAAERLFGYPTEEAIGQPITLIVPANRGREEEIILSRVRAGELIEQFETLRRHRDGTTVAISLTVSPIRDLSGTIVGASTIARDITDRKRAESEFADLHHRLLTLVSVSGSILGSPALDTVLSATITLAREVVAADAYALWRRGRGEGWRIVRSHGTSAAFAERMLDADAGERGPGTVVFDEPVIIEDMASSSRLEGLTDAYAAEGIRSMLMFPLIVRGEGSCALVFYYRARRRFGEIDVEMGRALANLSAAAITTAELYEEQRLQREAADHARQQAAFLADAGRLLGASLDYQQILAALANLAVPHIADWCAVDVVSEAGVVQRLAVAQSEPAQVDSARLLEEKYSADPNNPAGVHQVIRTGKPVLMTAMPASPREPGGEESWDRSSSMCVPLVAHGIAFGAITFVGAEARRPYDEQDLRFAQEVAARASLAVENARAYGKASEANRLKDEFLATLSHELRTPLNAILGYTRMLESNVVPAEKRDSALQVVARNAVALKQIVEDVLDVSRIVSGRLRLNVQPVDLPAILNSALLTVVPAADGKGVRLQTVIEPITTPVSGDPDRLQQILWNLLSNAIKFTPRGGRVQVHLARVNSSVEIVISDTGQGIDLSFLPYVFDRFRQADSGFGREHGGVGLGLAIVRQLVEMHGGTVSVASDGPGTGATFRVKLPLMIAHAVIEEERRVHPQTDQRTVPISSAPRLNGIRVMAVDDESDALGLLRLILEGAGAEVITVSSGAAAIEALQHQGADVLIADIGMPRMDGLQLIRLIRQTLPPPARDIPAAALTAYARSEDRITALVSGFQMHVPKPVDPTELIVAIAALTPRSRE